MPLCCCVQASAFTWFDVQARQGELTPFRLSHSLDQMPELPQPGSELEKQLFQVALILQLLNIAPRNCGHCQLLHNSSIFVVRSLLSDRWSEVFEKGC